MNITYRYRSVLMTPLTGPDGEPTGGYSFDPDTVQEHRLAVGPAAFFLDRGWVMGFVIASLATVPLFALMYGFMVLGLRISPLTDPLAGRLFVLSALLFLVVLWGLLGRGLAVRNLKWGEVVRTRGTGRWKLVDESKWPRFERLMTMAAARRAEDDAE